MAGLVLGTTMFGQFRLDVEGDAKIRGKIELLQAVGDSSLFIGVNAGSEDNGYNKNMFIGTDAGKINDSGMYNTFVGHQAGRKNRTNNKNSFFGYHAGIESSGWNNSFFGESAGANNGGVHSSFYGVEAGMNNLDWYNACFGNYAGRNSEGSSNSFFGYNAGKDNIGGRNAFFGLDAGERNEGSANAFFGYQSGFNNEGDENAFFGFESGEQNDSSQNAFFGYRAGYRNNIGTNNTFIGHEAGRNETAHINSTFLGANAGSSRDSLRNAIAIGHNANVSCDNCASIGGYGENAVSLGIGTGSPRARLHLLKSPTYQTHNVDYLAVFEDTTNAYIATLTEEEKPSGIIFQEGQFTFAGGIFYNNSSNPDGMTFRINGSNRMLMDANGNLGVGLLTPMSKLHILKGSSAAIPIDNSIATFENNDHAYLTLLTPVNKESGLIFGNPNKSAEAGIVYNNEQYPDALIFKNNNVANLIIDANGRVGIGNLDPDTPLHLTGGENNGTIAALKITSGGQNMLLDGNEIDSDSDIHLNHNSDRHVYAARGGGNMVIGGTNSNIDARLQVHGNAAKTSGGTTWTTFSDRRLKKNIRPYTDGLEQLLRIKPVRYRYNGQLGTSDEQEEIGIIAQDMQKIAPYMVNDFEHQDDKGRMNNYLTYNSNALFYMLVNGAKTLHQNNLDQQNIIEEQTETIQQLESKVSDLEKRFTQLEQVIDRIEQSKNESAQTIELKATTQLSQNRPNPFHQYTNIQYSIPNGVQKALMRITDPNGKILKEEVLNQVGKGQLQIKATHFPSGTYYYSLILDGRLFETKRMMLAWK